MLVAALYISVMSAVLLPESIILCVANRLVCSAVSQCAQAIFRRPRPPSADGHFGEAK
jgi:hypothetical protein